MRFQTRQADSFSIPLTPLIDVVFLLLLFFMLTTTFSQLDFLRVQLPQGDAESATAAESRINLAIDAVGDCYLDGERLPGETEVLAERLQEALAMRPDAVVYVYAHALTPHQSVVRLMAQVRAQGVRQMRIATLGEHLP